MRIEIISFTHVNRREWRVRLLPHTAYRKYQDGWHELHIWWLRLWIQAWWKRQAAS